MSRSRLPVSADCMFDHHEWCAHLILSADFMALYISFLKSLHSVLLRWGGCASTPVNYVVGIMTYPYRMPVYTE